MARHRRRPGREHEKRAGAVGGLGVAGPHAALAEGGRLLVAGAARDRDLGAEQGGSDDAEAGPAAARWPHLRQDRRRHAEEVAEPAAPGHVVDVEEERAAGVGDVGGVDAAAGEPPDEERVDRAEEHVARGAPRREPGDRLEEVHDLRGREIRIEEEPRALAHERFGPGRPQAFADRCRDAALPDDRRRHRRAGRAVPEDRRLPLVGDADGGDSGRGGAAGGEHAAGAGELRLPDLLGVVLDHGQLAPRGVGDAAGDLGKLLLRHGHGSAAAVEENRAARGRALIEREDAGGTAGGSIRRHGGSVPADERTSARPGTGNAGAGDCPQVSRAPRPFPAAACGRDDARATRRRRPPPPLPGRRGGGRPARAPPPRRGSCRG